MIKTSAVSGLLALAVISGCGGAARVAGPKVSQGELPNASVAEGKPVVEEPTLHSLGAYWIIKGDENRNARVEVSYRAAGGGDWKRGMDLFRVNKGDTNQARIAAPGQKIYEPELNPPADCWLFAGSILLLKPNTEYEVRLRLVDPDGGGAEQTFKSRTIAEPVAPAALRTLHVVPGSGGGSGTEADPLQGFAAAEKNCKAGDLVLVHKGVYHETLDVSESGERDHPIVWRAAGDGEVIIDGQGQKRFGIKAQLLSDVWFEGFTIRGVVVGISGNDSHHVVIRRCHIMPSQYGINFNGNQTGRVSNFFVSDNVIEGPCAWPRTKGIEDPGGIYMTGRGHVVCYNRVHNFADGIDTYHSKVCAAIDVHNNDISECTDDGAEMDFSERNTRNFNNRYTNIFQGISEQPIMGGPTYIFRNVLYNVGMEPFKLHHNGTPTAEVNWAPSGALFFHNTVVRKGEPWLVWSGAPVFNCVSRNNLFVGTEGEYACDFTCEMVGCDFDYDGFGIMSDTREGPPPYEAGSSSTQPAGPRGTKFLRWNRKSYNTVGEAGNSGPAERHATAMKSDTVFASGILPPADPKSQFSNTGQDLRIKPGCGAVDAGQVLPGINDGYRGKAPDLGAYELGDDLPHYGPRPAATSVGRKAD